MFVAVNKKNRQEVHSYTWTPNDSLIISGEVVDKDDWDIVEVEAVNKKWEYSLTTNTIWTSFDHGTVRAKTKEEARELAINKIKYDLDKLNDVLKQADVTRGFRVDMDFTQLELKEVDEL